MLSRKDTGVRSMSTRPVGRVLCSEPKSEASRVSVDRRVLFVAPCMVNSSISDTLWVGSWGSTSWEAQFEGDWGKVNFHPSGWQEVML